MVGFLEKINDGWTLLKTDRRFMSVGVFLSVVGTIYFLTETWREPAPEKEKQVFVPTAKPEIRFDPVRSMAAQIQERSKDRAELREVIKRTASDLQNGKQEMDWQMNELVDRLNTVGGKISKLAKDVGDREVEKAQIERKIKPAENKRRRTPKPVSQ